MSISSFILRKLGWKVRATVPDYPKCIICVAPHTSNWDFIIGKLAYSSIGRNAGFLMKSTWFFFPLGLILRAMGGIPVVRGKKGPSLVDSIVKKFEQSDTLQIAITPEGTRSKTDKWRTGFLQIAIQANVPCVLAAIDYSLKTVFIDRVFQPSGNITEDIIEIKDYYKQFKGKYPEKFSAD